MSFQRAVEEQQFNLREGAEIIIATPGRLKDIIERHVIVLSQCRYVVMDEADRMVHLGFEVDLTFILDSLPSETMHGEDMGEQMDVDGETMVKRGRTRVTTLFSATMPPAVERLARKYLKKPAVITIGEAGRAVDTVEQRVEFVSGDEKKKYYMFSAFMHHVLTSFISRLKLLEILNSGAFASPIIVFVNQKKTADMVAKDLQRAGVSVTLSPDEFFSFNFLNHSGVRQLCILVRTRNNERHRYNRYEAASLTFWSLLIWLDVVSTCRTSVLLSISKWLELLKPMFIVSVGFLLCLLSFLINSAFLKSQVVLDVLASWELQ